MFIITFGVFVFILCWATITSDFQAFYGFWPLQLLCWIADYLQSVCFIYWVKRQFRGTLGNPFLRSKEHLGLVRCQYCPGTQPFLVPHWCVRRPFGSKCYLHCFFSNATHLVHTRILLVVSKRKPTPDGFKQQREFSGALWLRSLVMGGARDSCWS